MDDLVHWLGKQLDEDERIARRVESSWRQIGETGVIVASDGERAEECANGNWTGIAEHIVEHDPARVLREIDAKRKLVDLHPHLPYPRGGVYCECMAADGVVETDGSYCDTLRLLALPYADHPGYREEWRP